MGSSPGFGPAHTDCLALFTLALAAAPPLCGLTSPAWAARRTVLQKVRGRAHMARSHSLWAQGFRFSFTPLPGSFSPFPHGTVLYRSLGGVQPYGVVPARSHRVPRAPWYSGSRSCRRPMRLRGRHPLWRAFPGGFRFSAAAGPCGSEPPRAMRVGLGSSPSARRYLGNRSFFLFLRLLRCFSSPGLPHPPMWRVVHGLRPCGSPHSDTCGSSRICRSPQLFAACHVFHRPPVPGHPPCALPRLTIPRPA